MKNKTCALFLIILITLHQRFEKLYDKTKNKVNYYSILFTPANSDNNKVIGTIKKRLNEE